MWPDQLSLGGSTAHEAQVARGACHPEAAPSAGEWASPGRMRPVHTTQARIKQGPGPEPRPICCETAKVRPLLERPERLDNPEGAQSGGRRLRGCSLRSGTEVALASLPGVLGSMVAQRRLACGIFAVRLACKHPKLGSQAAGLWRRWPVLLSQPAFARSLACRGKVPFLAPCCTVTPRSALCRGHAVACGPQLASSGQRIRSPRLAAGLEAAAWRCCVTLERRGSCRDFGG